MSVNSAYEMPIAPGWYLSGLGVPFQQVSPVGVAPKWAGPRGVVQGSYLTEAEARAYGPFRRMQVLEDERNRTK